MPESRQFEDVGIGKLRMLYVFRYDDAVKVGERVLVPYICGISDVFFEGRKCSSVVIVFASFSQSSDHAFEIE